jgi:hypothetical protein
MPPLLRSTALLLAAALLSASTDAGWTPLFNGRDLAGWVNVNCAPETFTVKDGMIHSTGAPICAMRTDRMYENYELEVEYQHLEAGGNAGIFLWSDALPAKGQPLFRTIEAQVLDGDTRPFFTGQGDLFAMHGALLTPDKPHPEGRMRSNPTENRVKPAGEWNHYRILVDRGNISLAVNGKVVTTATDASPRKGYIALESEGAPTLFRNLRIRERPADPALDPTKVATADEGFVSLYTGVDLRGWTVADADRTRWTVKDWMLVAAPDAGPLTSERSFEGVTIRFDWRVPAGTAAAGGDPASGPEVFGDRTIVLGPSPGHEAGTWHRTELTITRDRAAGDRFTMRVDGQPGLRGGVVPGTDAAGRPTAMAPGGRRLVLRPGAVAVEFANIFVRPDTAAGAHIHHPR